MPIQVRSGTLRDCHGLIRQYAIMRLNQWEIFMCSWWHFARIEKCNLILLLFFPQLADVDRQDRFKEPPKNGLFCDILWADPIENEDLYKDIQYRGNDVRGCSWFFGERAIKPLLDSNNFICVIRAHEAQLEGYRFYNYSESSKEFPSVITIFSAPNYCDAYNNKAAILKFDNSTLNIQQFGYSEHPYLLPHFLDIFSWSIPFVSEKVTEMLHHILTPRPGEDKDSDEEQDNKAGREALQRLGTIKKKNVDVTKNKIKFVSRMMMMQKVLRQENENIIKLKGLCPDKRIPRGLLMQGADGIKDALAQFNKAKEADRINEMRPDGKE